MKGTVKRDFKVLSEKISPENIAVMAELIAMRETKTLIGFLYISAKGKQITIKMECYLIITRMLSKRYRLMQKYQSLEEVKEIGEISCTEETETEYQQASKEDTLMEQMTTALNLTENMSVALDCRMSGMSYPEIAKRLSRAVSTVYEYFEKMRARYTAIYG